MSAQTKAVKYRENPFLAEKSLIPFSMEMFSPQAALHVKQFHQTMPGYQPTPLVRLDQLAKQIGVKDIFIKDESHRLGLNAFKVLGASYALCNALASAIGLSSKHLDFTYFTSDEARKKTSELTCITATDGNHGRAVAWTASRAGCRCVVYMPRGSSTIRLENIRKLGAKADIIDGNYDDAVKLAQNDAAINNWMLIQDTAMAGYEKIPEMIMQGYLTLFHETVHQLESIVPTHVMVQCGVGSLAAACQAFMVENYAARRPLFAVVEPLNAGCFFKSITAKTGRPHKVGGTLDTIMAGLACGEPNTLAWDILKRFSDMFIICPDDVTAHGMRLLSNPASGDKKIVSGESGAVTAGLLSRVMTRSELSALKRDFKLDHSSRILLFSTEGDTDPEAYRKIISDER